MNYFEQAKAFMNAYWNEFSDEAENIWGWTHQFAALDVDKGKEGCDLDEFNAHRFLEKLGETKTIRDLRQEFKDIDMDFNRRMAVLEYLLFRYKKTISDFVRRPQGDNTAEIQQAQRALDEAQASLESARIAQENATAEAQRSAQKAQESVAAEAELKQALAELHAQEDAYNRKKDDLQRKSDDQSLGVVQRNKAKNELAQHLGEDPLPLRKAKLTTEAATKKAEKARILAEEAAVLAEQAKVAAEQRAVEMEDKFAEAERYLEEIRSRPGGGQGALWWIERELKEAKKYMPKRRQ
jgi:chromosome segregation ATPase